MSSVFGPRRGRSRARVAAPICARQAIWRSPEMSVPWGAVGAGQVRKRARHRPSGRRPPRRRRRRAPCRSGSARRRAGSVDRRGSCRRRPVAGRGRRRTASRRGAGARRGAGWRASTLAAGVSSGTTTARSRSTARNRDGAHDPELARPPAGQPGQRELGDDDAICAQVERGDDVGVDLAKPAEQVAAGPDERGTPGMEGRVVRQRREDRVARTEPATEQLDETLGVVEVVGRRGTVRAPAAATAR